MLSFKWVRYAEEMATHSRSFRRFNNAIQTDATRSNYSYSINRFMRFLVENKFVSDIKAYDELLNFNADQITDYLEDFVFELNSKIRPSGIMSMIAAPELFFEMNRKVWHKKLVRKSINKDNVESTGNSPITTAEIRDMLQVAKHPRDVALIHFFASTGARPAAIFDPVLRMKHLEYMPNPDNPDRKHNWCYAVRIYDESREGYWAFLTPEATRALEKYHSWRKNIRHEKFTDETPVFANFARHAQRPHLSDNSIKEIFRSLINRSALPREKKGNRYNKALIYMFRKRFNTILKLDNSVNSNIAEKLMAHKKGLDGVYLQPTREECFKEFVKAILHLTIDSSERDRIELEQANKEKSELQQRVNEIEEMRRQQADENARRDQALEYLMRKEREREAKN